MADLEGPDGQALVSALCAITDPAVMRAFLEDLLTVGEVSDLTHRFRVARLILQGATYEEVARATGASSATISRIRRFVEHGSGGYRLAAQALQGRPPAGGD